jgi:fatty acid-binding protein DegV
MKVFQIRENRPQQILVLPITTVKKLQKNGTPWAIEHVLVWCIIYEQRVANVSIRINKKLNIKVLVEN